MTELERFEAWMISKYISVDKIPEKSRWGDRIHVSDFVHIAWGAWQARAASPPPAAALAAPQPVESMMLDWLETWHDGFANIDSISAVNRKFNGHATLREAIADAMASQNRSGGTLR